MQVIVYVYVIVIVYAIFSIKYSSSTDIASGFLEAAL